MCLGTDQLLELHYGLLGIGSWDPERLLGSARRLYLYTFVILFLDSTLFFVWLIGQLAFTALLCLPRSTSWFNLIIGLLMEFHKIVNEYLEVKFKTFTECIDDLPSLPWIGLRCAAHAACCTRSRGSKTFAFCRWGFHPRRCNSTFGD